MLKKIIIFFLCFPFLFAQASSIDSLIDTLDGTSSHIDGPNCWNGALFGAGVIEHKRFLHPDEWLTLLRENCREIKGAPLSGDVGRLFIEDTEVHGFIHVNEELIFAKHGQDKKDGYQVMTYEEMLDQYGRTRSCRIKNSYEPECFHELTYYRCETKKEYEPLKTALFALLERILFAEETKSYYKENCSEGSFVQREVLLKKMVQLLEEMKERGISLSEERDSLVTQVYDIEVSNRVYRCSRTEKRETVKKVKDLIKELSNEKS